MLLSFKADYLRIRPQNRTTFQEKITCLFDRVLYPHTAITLIKRKEKRKTIFFVASSKYKLNIIFFNFNVGYFFLFFHCLRRISENTERLKEEKDNKVSVPQFVCLMPHISIDNEGY